MPNASDNPQIVTPHVISSPEIDPTYKCARCSSVIMGNDGYESVDGLICELCRDDYYFCCEECGEIHHTDQVIYLGRYCCCSEKCANRQGWYKCNDCFRYYQEIDSGYQNDSDEGICESCAGNYCSCDDCERIICVDNSYSIGGSDYCADCYGGQEGYVIKDYSYRPSEYKYSKMAWENTTYLGIELEIECGEHSISSIANKVTAWLVSKKLDNMVYLKEDSSLTNGFEIVWMPQTLQAIHKKFPMKSFLGYMQGLGVTSHKKGSCGLHVHLSRRGLTTIDIWKGKIFFYKCASFLMDFSARRHGRKSWEDREIFGYCKFDNVMPVNGSEQEHGRYSAFNTCNTSTVELRLFRGTLIYDRFQASLQFSDAFVSYIKSVGVCYLKNTSGNVIWVDFINYCKGVNRYGQFVKYVVRKGII